MRKTLASAADREEIERRIGALTTDAVRMWGMMSVGGMICHLDDSFQLGLGERNVTPVRLPIPRGLIKYLALRTSMRWTKNMKTMDEVRQGGGGSCPGPFTADQARLLDTVARFSACQRLAQAQHPFFGAMLADDWLRWGYLHADHHLRQFSM
jgi:hypothetical protein